MSASRVTVALVEELAKECGFELAGIAPVAAPADDFERFEGWVARGMAGRMGYLTDRRAGMRNDARNLLPEARSVICVAKLYNHESKPPEAGQGVIARYALSRDYHDVIPSMLERLVEKLHAIEPFTFKICVDTAPLLERSFARQAGLGWIGRNTCLINEQSGSWFLLGEIIVSLDLAPGIPPPDRCGTCTRCIDACPTQAIVPSGNASPRARAEVPDYTLDARRCISYLNIELKGEIPEELRARMGSNVFGCDICQQVCPWNTDAPVSEDPEFAPQVPATPALTALAQLSAAAFQEMFRDTPIPRPKYAGFLRNVAVAMGASGNQSFTEPLRQLAQNEDGQIASHAQWALHELQSSGKDREECVELE
ncbi:MAG: tRNA epoxyqueuosine(34) reductase QueG [Bryobacteraceae bacterium]